MKWPKSEEKTKIGGSLEQLGGPPPDILLFFCEILPKNVFTYFQNEVGEIREENLNWGGLENVRGPPDGVPLPSQKFGCAKGSTTITTCPNS